MSITRVSCRPCAHDLARGAEIRVGQSAFQPIRYVQRGYRIDLELVFEPARE